MLHVMEEIQNAAEHFTHIRASRNQHKALGSGLGGTGGLEANKPASREGDVMIQVTVPYRVVGLVVGLKGQTIKAIQQDTDTFIVTPNRDKAPIFEIRGQPENVERAKSMILRHIETRTRHCRLQDSTNLPGNWGMDETTRGGSSGSTGGIGDFSMFQHHHSGSSSNNDSVGSVIGHSHGNMSLSNANSNFNSNHSFTNAGGSLGSSHFSPSFAASNSPPVNGNYGSWGGYSGMFDHQTQHNSQLQQQHQQQNSGGSMTTWSTATTDFTPLIGSNGMNSSSDPASFCNGSPHQGIHSSMRSSHHKNFQSMAMGSMSSSSNSSASISPPHDFITEGPYPSSHHGMSIVPFCPSVGTSPPLHGLLPESAAEAGDFSNFPLLSAGSSSPGSTKGSLVLGNLFRSSNSGASSNGGLPMMGSSSGSTNSSSNSTASPTSTDGFHRGEDHLNVFTGAGFAAGGPSSTTPAPVNSLGASSSPNSSSSSSYPLVADTTMFSGASGSGIQLMLRDSSGGTDGGSGGCNRFLNGESSPTSKASPSTMNEGPCSQGSPTPRLCRVCEEAEVVAALVPCGHNLFCMECAEMITNRPSEDDRKCPVCKESAAGVLRIRA